jgi:hypothetical protein
MRTTLREKLLVTFVVMMDGRIVAFACADVPEIAGRPLMKPKKTVGAIVTFRLEFAPTVD